MYSGTTVAFDGALGSIYAGLWAYVAIGDGTSLSIVIDAVSCLRDGDNIMTKLLFQVSIAKVKYRFLSE